jgi:adenosylcobinamide amidohydrolase
MALPTDTFSTYDAIGNREDLSDVIYRIDPTDTPFISSIERVKATAVNHEWQTQALAAASTSNAVLEGDDATTDAATATVRLGNIAQISDKVARVTGTQQAVKHAGRDDELDYQAMLKGLELKRDMESILLMSQAKDAGNATTARKLGSINSWIATNDDFDSGGSSPSPITGADARNDGTQRAFTEAQVKNVCQLIWTAGGKPDTIMVGAFNKQQFSTFTGRATPMEETKSKKIIASVDAYESDFGVLKVVANRFQRSRDCHIIQTDMWALATLRNMKEIDLAVTGDSRRRQVIAEYTLEARNEKSSGGVYDLTTS